MHLEKGQVLEGARCGKCKRYVISNKINKNDRKKCALFTSKHPLKTCIHYCTNGPATYSFYLDCEYYINLINIPVPRNENMRTTRRSRRYRS